MPFLSNRSAANLGSLSGILVDSGVDDTPKLVTNSRVSFSIKCADRPLSRDLHQSLPIPE